MSNYLTLLFLGAVWGSSFLFLRLSVPNFGPIWIIQFRVGIAAIFILLIILFFQRKIIWRGYLKDYGLISMLNLVFPFILFAYAAQTLSASVLSVINATSPFFASIFVALFLKHRLSPTKIIGLVIGFCGVIVLLFDSISTANLNSLTAMLAAILAPLCYGLFSTYITYRELPLPPLMITLGTLWSATIILLPFSLSHDFYSQPQAIDWFSVAMLGMVCTGLAYILLYRMIKKIGSISTLTVTFLVPFFGTLWGVIFLAEPLSWELLFGGILILVGVAISNKVLMKKFDTSTNS